jgi:ribulose-5-phosphate 4-epimerase/fuculose-1-phosphate aldolase
MSTPSDIAAVHRRFRTVGSALMRVNLNNTHSGNISCRDPQDPGRFWVTASGSPCGDLSQRDLVAVRFEDMGWEGPARPSSEAKTHRRVLSLPGVNACVHCHSIASTLLGFESPQKPIFLLRHDRSTAEPEDYLFQPVDLWGAHLIGPVAVGVYKRPVGSAEMEERIPGYLRRAPLTIVMGHGPFARGESLEECLLHLSVLENSSAVAIALRRRGIDTLTIQRAIQSHGAQAAFPLPPRRLARGELLPEPTADAATRSDFAYWLSYNFNFGLGAFGTGSMSRRLSADEMLFCPMSAAPEGVELTLHRLPLRAAEPEAGAADVRLHRRIYAHTRFTACMATSAPLATAEATATWAEAHGLEALTGKPDRTEHAPDRRPRVAPIDAEAAYYKARLPVAGPDALAAGPAENRIPSLLVRGNGCCLIAGCGVIAAGEEGLGQAAYRVSLAERMARFRQEVDLNHRLLGGPAVAAFE